MERIESKDARWGEKQFEGSNGDLKESMTDMKNQTRSRAEMQIRSKSNQLNFIGFCLSFMWVSTA